MATFRLESWLNESPSTAQVTLDGVEIFNGEVGAGSPVGETIELCEFSSTGGNISVTVDSGYLKVGQVQCLITMPVWQNNINYGANVIVQDGNPTPGRYESLQNVPAGTLLTETAYWQSLGTGDPTYWSFDCRNNIKINGADPAWPSTAPFPGGTESAPDWTGWFFDAVPGDTVTFTVTPRNN